MHLATGNPIRSPLSIEALPAPSTSVEGNRIRVLKPRSSLFFEGDEFANVYEIVEGVFRASKVYSDGRRQIVTFAYPGDIIGFAQGDRYRFDCDALTLGKVLPISRHAMLSAVKTRPSLAEKLISAATHQICITQELSMILCRKSALERVASFLCGFREKTGSGNYLRLPMTRADIADYLGLTIETVSRNMTKLRQQGIIELPEPACIRILDLSRLQGVAEADLEFH